MSTTLDALRTPALVVDAEAAARNAAAMRARAASRGVALRPHLKTHKTVEGALLQVGGDRTRPCVVSTLGEARWFAKHGFNELLYAVPIGLDRLPEVLELNKQGTRVQVLIDTHTAAEYSDAAARAAGQRLGVFLKLDCGYGRAGVPAADPASIALARRLATADSLDFQGIYCHAGHSYGCCNTDEIEAAAEEERRVAAAFAAALRTDGIPVPHVSVGATPTCSGGRDWTGCTELHPGNYLFYDVQQVAAGSASWDDCACFVLTRVLSVYPDRRRALIDAGGLALSKDTAPDAYPGFGRILGHPDLVIRKISQEVGIVEYRDGRAMTEADLPLGTLLLIIPNHACLAAACFDRYEVVHSVPRTDGPTAIDSLPVVGHWTRCPERW